MSDPRPALAAQIHALIEQYFAHPEPGADELRLPLHAPSFGADEVNEALDCLLSTRVTMGDKVRRFEALWRSTSAWPRRSWSTPARRPTSWRPRPW